MQLKTFQKISAFLPLLGPSVVGLPVEAPSTEVTTGLHPLITRAADPEPATYKPSKLEEQSITDQYLFNITLESFVNKRNQQCPPYLFWESDGCSESPDHPFGFDYLPACYRHDFGYDQYRRVGNTQNLITSVPQFVSFLSLHPKVVPPPTPPTTARHVLHDIKENY